MVTHKVWAGAGPTGSGRRKHRRAARLALGLVVALVMVVLFAGAALAQELPGTLLPGPAGFSVLMPSSEPVSPDGPNGPFDDGGAWEVGIEGTAGNLPVATAAERAGMWFWLNGWFVKRFSYNEATAWEEDFKRAALGGTENSYLDAVDLMFYVGHGSPGNISFFNAAHDDGNMVAPGDCDTSWGDRDNEWLAMTSCQVMSGPGLGNLAQCMNRQHLVLGFVTNASAHNNVTETQAYHFGRYMRFGYNMTQAWFRACDVADRGRIVRVMAEETACFNDNPYYGSVCADFYDNDYYWFTHNCGTPSAGPVPDALLQGVNLPVLKVAAYSEADAEDDFLHLSAVFSVPVTSTVAAAGVEGVLDENPPPSPPAGSPFLFANSNNQVLQMDEGSGLFEYADLNQLWTAEIADALLSNPLAASVNAVDQRILPIWAATFLRDNKLLPADAVPAGVVADAVGGAGRGQVMTAAQIEQQEIPAAYQVLFARNLPVTVATAAGVMQVDLAAVGPGSKLKVFYPSTTPNVTAAGVQQAPMPIAVQGGWRALQPAGVPVEAGVEPMVVALPSSVVQAMYLALDDLVAMNTIPISVTSQNVISASLAYWESAPGTQQGELIPVYELNVEIVEADTGNVSMVQIYVPAAPVYLKPIAIILPDVQVASVDAAALPGAQITLNAADASQTLAQLGLGNAFNFVAGYNGAATTFQYDWYIGEPIPPNKIAGCSTRTCTFRAPLISPDKGGQIIVTLVVTDVDSPNLSQGLATTVVEVQPVASLLPLVERP